MVIVYFVSIAKLELYLSELLSLYDSGLGLATKTYACDVEAEVKQEP